MNTDNDMATGDSSSLTLTQCIDVLRDWMAGECVPEEEGGPIVASLKRVVAAVGKQCTDLNELARRIRAEVE